MLGVFAIWLSAVLYRFSTDAMEKVREIATQVHGSVAVLDAHIGGLHSDTFSLFKETVSDMRGALFTQPHATDDTAAEKAQLEAQLASLRHELVADISSMLGQEPLDSKALALAVDTVLRRSADAGVSAGENMVGRLIKDYLSAHGREDGAEAAEVMTVAAQRFPFGLVVRTLLEMRAKGELHWSDEDLRASTFIRVGGSR